MRYEESNKTVIVRGGGDLATGVVQKFHRAGFNVLILEIATPTAIRRSVALCEAIYDGYAKVEDIVCRKVNRIDEILICWQEGEIPLIIDPDGEMVDMVKPAAVIDAILAKRNLGTTISMADVTIALGPGFNAGEDVHAVIETMRGHDLGRMILNGYAKPDTGIPGEIAGESDRRVVRAPSEGIITHKKKIGSIVEQGEVLFTIKNEDTRTTEVNTPFTGLLRGLIREGIKVSKGMKAADIDPRTYIDWRTISDKARCLGGAALEAYYYLNQRKGAGS